MVMTSFKVISLMTGAAIAASAAGHAMVGASFAANMKPRSVVLESGNPQLTLAKGDTTIETATISCPYSAYDRCSLSLSIMANVGNSTCRSEWAILGLVDGNSVDGGPFTEGLPIVGNTQTNLWQGTYTVSTGSHTVAFQLYMPCPANANQWSVRYVVNVP